MGSFATATGALSGGWLAQILQSQGMTAGAAYRVVLMGYAAGGFILTLLFMWLTPDVEIPVKEKVNTAPTFLGLHKSRGVVLRLSALFALDAFAGGFVVQSMVAYWFHVKYGVDSGLLGSIFFGANVLAGISALLAVSIAKKIGLLNTMVFTHVPSNILLMLVPLMPNLPLAILVLLLRFSISQMDVPTRQSYTVAVVDPNERSAAAGVTGIARSIGASLSPVLTGILLGIPGLLSAPFILSGGLKLVYDFLLYRSFQANKPPEESH